MKRLPYIIFLTAIFLAACNEEEMIKSPDTLGETEEILSKSGISDSLPNDSMPMDGINMPINKDRGSKPGQTKINSLQ